MTHLILLTRNGCTLCDELKPIAVEAGATIENMDTDADALALGTLHGVDIVPTLLECEAPTMQDILSPTTETRIYVGEDARKRLEAM